MAQPPVTERGRATRERLIAAAADLIRDQGVERTSLDQVLAHTGTSKSQLYHYFDDKDALVREVIAYRTQSVLRDSAPFMEAANSWSGVRRWFAAIVAAQESDDCRHGCPIGTLAAELADYNEPARAELAHSFECWHDEIKAVIDRLQAAGRLPSHADTSALAGATLAAIQGGLLLSKTLRDPLPLRRALDAAYDHLRTSASTA
jgi:AcrR family transcriptional regulator